MATESKTNDAQNKAEQLLKMLRIFEDDSHVYQLGCTALLLNIHAQQQRAFNLVWALQQTEDLKDLDVGIVGAGISGLTVATALIACGAKVRIYESMRHEMHLQQGNMTRFLHPNLADWPEDGFGFPQTQLPYMNWRAASAADVVEQLKFQWLPFAKLAQDRHLLEIEFNTRVTEIVDHSSSSVQIRRRKQIDKYGHLRPAERHSQHLRAMLEDVEEPSFEDKTYKHRILIVAVGYGLEQPRFSNTPSYWRNDDFAQPVIGAKNTRRYLVSGTGDGGLIDCLRLTLHNFQHQKFIQEVMYKAEFRELGKKFKNELKACKDETSVLNYWLNFYGSSAELPDQTQKVLNETFDDFIRTDTLVVLNSRRVSPFLTQSQIIHRLAVATLLRKKRIRHVPGELKSVYCDKANSELVAFVHNIEFGPSKPHYERVDVVVERLNSVGVLSNILGKDGDKIVENLTTKWQGYGDNNDLTVKPCYEVGFLSDEFKFDHFEDKYQIGAVKNFKNTKKFVLQILSNLEQGTLAAKYDKGTVTLPITGVWHDKAFQIVEGILPDRLSSTDSKHAVIFETSSRELLEHALDKETPEYHFVRIFVQPTANNFEIDPSAPIDTKTGVTLHNCMSKDNSLLVCFESTYSDAPERGMRSAHLLLRVPTLLELLGNQWPITKVGGIGWAVTATLEHLREDKKASRLLQWDNHAAWWFPLCQ